MRRLQFFVLFKHCRCQRSNSFDCSCKKLMLTDVWSCCHTIRWLSLFFLPLSLPKNFAFLTCLTLIFTHKTTFTKTYCAILSPFVEPFKEATTEKEKKALIKDAVDAVKKSKALLEDAEDLPKDLVAVCLFLILCFHIHWYSLTQVVRRCLKTSAEKDVEREVTASKSKVQNQKPKKVKPTYTIQDVIKENYRSLIDSEIPYLLGKPEYILRF